MTIQVMCVSALLAVTGAVVGTATVASNASVDSRSGRVRQAPSDSRLEGPAILKHPIGNLALDYVSLVHAEKMEEAMKLATTAAQARWKAEPASERRESAAFRKKLLPNRDELFKALSAAAPESGRPPAAVLLIEKETRATLNIIRIEQRSKTPGVSDSSSTTTALPFEKENGQWKLAR